MSSLNARLEASGTELKTLPKGGLTKRVMDVALASSMLLAFLPLMVFISLLIATRDGGKVYFGHERIGFGGRRFRCLKFRSMVADSDAVLARHLAENPTARREWEDSHKLRHDPRVTPLGRFLRETSLDELPQLINVIRGEMSLVGPRPIVSSEVPRYASNINAYYSVRPGVTGLWQVSGRSDLGYARRVSLDSQYVSEWSIWGDVRILMKTVWVVFTRSGSY